MESWSYVSEGKNFVSDESVSATDGIGRSKSGFMGFENCTFMCSSHDNLKNQEFVELGGGSCNNIMRKPLAASDSITDVLSSHYGCERVYNPITAAAAPPPPPPPPSNTVVVPGEEESSSKLSSSIVDSNCRDSSLIDLKLGRFSDHRDAQTKANPIFSSAESPIPPTKRARAGSLSSQTPFCQVHGCKKDLTSSKDYHKRHKVCEIHSKTSKVIVNGIEQRFCQQCSRFHLLAEFDDGKRSCRKRLAGHNERRRRPHIGMHSGRAGRLFQSYDGSRLHQGTSFALSSFVCQDILPNSILHPQKYEMNNDWYRSVKMEDEGNYSPHLGIPNTKGQIHTKSHLTSFSSQKQCLPEDGFIALTRTKMNENSSNSSFLHSISTTSDFHARSLFHNSSSLGNGELTVLDSSSTVQGLPAVSNSGCALSLLSSQSQNSSNQSCGIPTALPLITTTSHSHSHYGVTQVSEKLMRVSPQTSTSAVSNAFHSSGITSAEETQMEPILISSNGIESVNYGGINGIIHHSSPYLNAKNDVSCGDGSTIDLLQLSSQLQRVEHQRQQSMRVKQEADAFFGLRIT